MGSRRRVALACAALLTATAATAACKRAAPVPVREGEAAPPPPPPAKPIDHLAPDELVEGSSSAFGLPLPREVTVERTFADVVYAWGSPQVKPIVKYLRTRVREGGVREGEATASFERVKIPGNPGKDFQIAIARLDGRTRIEVRDVTPQPGPDLPDSEARYRRIGLTKDGRVLDPTHVE
jgi:hypothetical protein